MMKKKFEDSKSCAQALQQLTHLMEEEDLTDGECIRLISRYPGCADVITAQYDLWRDLGDITVPEPSSDMDARFYKYLNEAQMEMDRTSWWTVQFNRFNQWLQGLHPGIRWSMVIGVFVLGVLLGRFGSLDQQVDTLFPAAGLEQIVESLPEEKVVLAGFSARQSASTRLKGVQMVKDLQNPDERIFAALNQVLLHDPSDNVRVSAIESLLLFADRPEVREYLIEAIPFQDSPWVLVALADAMILLEEEQSADRWKLLLESGQVEMEVRMQLEETLEPIL